MIARAVLPACLLLALVLPGRAAGPADFLATYCHACHGEEKQKGDRRFDTLEFPVAGEQHIIALQEMIDQLNLGEMPPEKAERQPGETERAEAIAALTQAVSKARASLRSTGGQTVLRRLNRREYRNTVADLLGLDLTAFDPTTTFPRDRLDGHMDNIGDALVTSGYLLDQYLEAADILVEKALGPTARPEEKSWDFKGNFRQGAELDYSHKTVYGFKYLCLYEVPNTNQHEGGYGYVHDFREGVPVDGLYEIKVLAHAVNRDHPYNPALFGMDPDQPYRIGIVPGDIRAGILHHPQPMEPTLAEVAVGEGEPEWRTMTVWLNAGQTPRFIFPNGMADCRRAFGRVARDYKAEWPEKEREKASGIFEARRIVLTYGKMPHLRIHEVKIRGPILEQWPPDSQRRVFGNEGFDPASTRRILTAFADRAYRRPVREEEVDHLMAVVAQRREAGQSPRDALKDGLKAALCSPAFLYLSEAETESGKPELGPHDLASRLSYFLWATMPDDALRARADDGSLLRTDVLRSELARMLADPRSEAFIAGFLDSWLGLRDLGGMPPDREAFGTYYSKDLETAMRRETALFTRHLITENRPITDFLSADYTFVNAALATHYGLAETFAPAEAHLFRKVRLEDPRRGGLLGMGSVLTVTANGIETSPVIRGVWLLENILGTPPSPPPDDVPAIDPDVRGTTTVRDQLTKHRESPTCQECHRKIDPPGFALENFDPVGAWRDHYPLGKKRGPKIDASAELGDGEAFTDVVGFKRLLLQREELFARTLAERLLTYATGRHIEALERPEIDRILERVKADGNGKRTLIEACVESPVFRSR